MALGKGARGVVVRHAHCTVHLGTVAEVADLMRSLAGPPASADARPDLGVVAGVICSAAAEATAALGQNTVARGWQALRAAGRRPRAALERAVRELDAAAALLRHPAAVGRSLALLRGWLDDGPGPRADKERESLRSLLAPRAGDGLGATRGTTLPPRGSKT